MAKQSSPKGGTSRIRFIMLDAEIPEGDLSQITAAIQNALKPTTIIQQKLPPETERPALFYNGAPDKAFDEEQVNSNEDVISEAPPRAARSTRARKPTVPKVLDLDLDSEVSFKSFAEHHPPTGETERNLVVAAWFKEHRSEDAITSGHVYTCYRSVGWSVGIEDFAWPLRALKKEQLMSSRGRGLYAINHLGLDRVKKLGRD